MTELLLIPLHLLALVFGSAYFHTRFRCFRASCFSGFGAAWIAVVTLVAVEDRSTNPADYIGGFIYGGIGIWIFSSLLSGLIGIAFPLERSE